MKITRPNRLLFSDRGISIIEVIIGMAIAVIGFLGAAELVLTISKVQVNSQHVLDETTLRYEVSSILFNPNRCTNALHGTPSTDNQPVALSPQLSTTKGAVNYGELQIKSIELKNVSGPLNGVSNLYSGDVEISGSTQNGNPFGFDDLIYYSTSGSNGSNQLEYCYGADDVCTAMGGKLIGTSCNFCASLGGIWLTSPTPHCGYPVVGSCGPGNGGSYPAASSIPLPLCSTGTAVPSSLSGAGPWSWTCMGKDGGANASCSAGAVCVPGSWANGACGGSCPAGDILQTRTVTPAGCAPSTQCVPSASCSVVPTCTAGSWSNSGCGGSCPAGDMLQTRTVSPAGCTASTQCVPNASCGGTWQLLTSNHWMHPGGSMIWAAPGNCPGGKMPYPDNAPVGSPCSPLGTQCHSATFCRMLVRGGHGGATSSCSQKIFVCR